MAIVKLEIKVNKKGKIKISAKPLRKNRTKKR